MLLNAQNEDGEINCSKVRLTFGNLIGTENHTVLKDDVGFHFSWANNSTNNYIRKTDQLMLVAYDLKHKKAIYLLSGTRRQKKILEIPILLKGNKFHTWISFISDDRESIAMSTYTGYFIF